MKPFAAAGDRKNKKPRAIGRGIAGRHPCCRLAVPGPLIKPIPPLSGLKARQGVSQNLYLRGHTYFASTNKEKPPSKLTAISSSNLNISLRGKKAIFDFRVFLGKSIDPAV